MTDSRKWLFVLVVSGLLLGLGSFNANAQLTCTATSGVPEIVRAEGVAELMGDALLECTGGTPTPAGQPIPLQNVQVTLNTTITSKIVGAGNVSEALLLIDEPFPSVNQVPSFLPPSVFNAQAQLACLANNTTNCAITSVGSGIGTAGSYNGSAGHYNVFQGSQTGVNTISWVGVPIDAPGTAGTRIIRITNIRGNASLSAVSSITEMIAANGSSYPNLAVGQIVQGLLSSVASGPGAFTQCTAPGGSISVTATEGFGHAFGPQSYGQLSSAFEGTYASPGGATETYQNVPGFRYNAESGFRPDPAIGTGTFVDPSGNVGLATQGTQIQFTIAGVGAGVSLSVPSYIYLSGAYGDGTQLGVAVLTGQTAPAVVLAPNTGTPGPNVPLTSSGGTATAVYEIYYADSSVQETATVPISVSYAPGVAPGTSTVTVSYAPLSSNPNASSTDPIPRFLQSESPATLYTIAACANSAVPTVTSISPNSGADGSTVQVTLTGTNFVAGATVNVGNSGVSVTNVRVVSPTQITATFVIAANAAWGSDGVTVSTSGGTSGAVPFAITPPAPTLTSISPSSVMTGTEEQVTLTGMNFEYGFPVDGQLVSVNNSGVYVSNVSVVSNTQITATFLIAAGAPTGPAKVTVTTSSGTSGPVILTVNPSTPTLTSITPNSGLTGSTVQINLTGTNFIAGTTVSVNNPGVAVSNVNTMSSTQITATFVIAANAAPGPSSVTVTTLTGKSGPVSFTINPPPLITLSTASLSFAYIQGSGAPASQSFGVLSTGETVNYSVSATTSSGGGWLTASPVSGQTPGNVTVSPGDLASLNAGTYNGTVTVQPQSRSIAAQTVAVSLQVTGAQPQVSLSTSDLRFSVNAGSPAIPGFIQVLNAGGGAFNYSVTTAPASWLTITCGAQGSATSSSPGLICVQVNPASLPAATYFDSLMVTGAGQSLPVNATLQVSSSATSILLSSTGMTFTAIAGANTASPASQTVAVLNQGQGTMNWTAQAGSNASWLTISPASGSSQALGASQPAITFTTNPAGLAAGNYYAVVNVTAPDGSAPNSPAAITVLLKVLPASTQLPASVSASGLIFAATAGGAAPATQQIDLINDDESAISYSFTSATDDGQAWLSAGPLTGSLPIGGSSQLSIQINPAGQAAGTYYGQLRLGYSNSTEENVDVVLLVTPASNSQWVANAVPQPKASAFCSQYGLAFDQPVPTDGGTVIAGQQYTLRLKSLCVPSPPSGLNVEIDFSDGTAPLYPTFDSGSGDYEVTWTPTQAENVQFYAHSNPVNAGGLSLVTTATQPFSVTVTAPDPTGSPILDGVRNSASYSSADEVAAGSFISIFGAQLASSPAFASSVPFPAQLGGIQATLAGTPLPLYYASTGQVNAVIPFLPEQLLDTPQSLVVYRNGAPALLSLNLVVYQPGIFSTAANGTGQGAIQNASYQLVDGGHPAQPGDAILIYSGGLGPVVNPPAAGALASAGSTTKTIPNVYIDGIQAQVVYSGLSPGSVQLYQVNAVVPQGIHSGALNVYLTITDPRSNTVLQSNTVTIN